MKNLMVILAIILLTGCHQKTPDEKAKDLIGVYMKNHLNDYSSYQPVQFGKLDSAFTSFANDTAYLNLIDSANQCETDANSALESENIYSGLDQEKTLYFASICKQRVNAAKHYSEASISFLNAFKPQFIGFKINHSFRAKNALGNLNLAFWDFYFDAGVNRLIKHIDVTDDSHPKEVIDTL